MYRLTLALLLVTACSEAPTGGAVMKTPRAEEIAVPGIDETDAPVAAPHAREPRLPAAPPTEEAPPPNHGQLLPNGCHEGDRDLGACCAPQIDPGDCDCRTGNLCTRSCKYDSNHESVVAVYCVDGGV
jgi:hypothetical protein